MKMKLLLLLPLFCFGNYVLFAQSAGVTFSIETLQRPVNFVTEVESEVLLKKIAPQQMAHSKMPGKIVEVSAHPFFDGMYLAYSEHRPFVITPDMIWLLICQGFSQHVNNNAEQLRSMFVNFDGKKSLIVKISQIQSLNDPATWEGVIPGFVQQVAENTDKDLMANLTPTFSTTTSIEKIATQITALESMHAYFEYIVRYCLCGIPEITIKGTPQDWRRIKENANALRKYQLDWWMDELDPLLDKFIDASNGKFSKHFWRNMFKYHTKKEYGTPKIIDGWIIKFYPYDKKGKRNDFKMLRSSENLPDECATVDFRLEKEHPSGGFKATDMQFVAGFFGLNQNHKTQALEPQIGWLVTPKDTSARYQDKILTDLKWGTGIEIIVSEIPSEILAIKSIGHLNIEFLDSIRVPVELSLNKIEHLTLKGKISPSEEQHIVDLFPNTQLYINQRRYHNK